MARQKRAGLFGLRAALKRAVRGEDVPRGPFLVRFEGSREGELEGDTTLLDAAHQLGVDMSSYCGGHCSCGTCRIEIVEGADNLSGVEGNEQMVLGARNLARGDRLACQARIRGPVTVRVPSWF